MNNQNLVFSIITVIYNAKEDLKKTTESIQDQKFKNFEHVIIDGGSNDDTLDYIKSMEYNNFKYISEKDNGIYDAMNKGIDLANGEYLLFLNAADTFAKDDVLENIAKKIEKDNSKILYGGANIYSKDGNFLRSLRPLNLNKNNLNIYATRVVCHQSIFVHKSIVKPYSDKYRLKGELNWYYDLIENTSEDEIMKLDYMICNYYLGGTGDTNFWDNYFERIKVTKERNSLFKFIVNIVFFLIPLVFRLRRIIFGK